MHQEFVPLLLLLCFRCGCGSILGQQFVSALLVLGGIGHGGGEGAPLSLDRVLMVGGSDTPHGTAGDFRLSHVRKNGSFRTLELVNKFLRRNRPSVCQNND